MPPWRDLLAAVRRITTSRFAAKRTQRPDEWVSFASGALSLDQAALRDPKATALLALLWQSDPAVSSSHHAGLEASRIVWLNSAEWTVPQSSQSRQETHSLKELVTFIERHAPCIPRTETERAAALVLGLSASLRHNLRELRQTDEIFPLLHLSDAVRVCGALQLTELHEPLCELLVGAHQAIRADRDGPRVAPCETLRRQTQTLLAALPPGDMPILWRMLRDPEMSPEFWPVLEKMRQPASVPYLLDVIPSLNDGGRASVVIALQNIGDARAIPYLQHLAQGEKGTVARMAASAIAHILKHNRGDAAQLLRASNARDIHAARATLLRAARPAPDAAPDELLRAAQSGLHGADDKPLAAASGHEKG